MRIAVIGAGAIGGTTAGLLAREGFDVTLVCKYPEVAAKIRDKGLRLNGLGKNLLIRIPAVASVDEIEGQIDLILLATKAMDMNEAARTCLPVLKSDSKVVSMQNGIMEEELAEIVGTERTIGCVVGFGATLHAYGTIELTSRGEMWLGYLDRDPDPALEEISRILGNIAETNLVERIMPILYAKLIINSCTSTLGAISGMELGKLLKYKRIRQLFLEVGREALSVADAMQLEVPSYNGKIRFRKILNYPAPVQHLVIRMIGIKYRKLRSTNLQSLERGGTTEIQHLNGYIVSKAESLGVKTPVNKRLLMMVQEIENKKRSITQKNLEDWEL